MSCGVLPPNRPPFDYQQGKEIGGCTLPIGHQGPHRCCVVEGRDFFPLGDKRTRYQWDMEDDCGCCDIRDPDRCFWHGEI